MNKILKIFALVFVVVVLPGCAGLENVASFNSPNGVLKISSDFKIVPACRGNGYMRETECQRGYNQEVNRQVESRVQATYENYQAAYHVAYNSVSYDPNLREVVSTLDCNFYSSSSYESGRGCRDGLLAGRQKALDEMRSNYLPRRDQMDRDRGAGKAAGALK